MQHYSYHCYDIYIEKKVLGDGQIKLQLIDAEDGLAVCTPTVILPVGTIDKGNVAIKDYSENEGILSWLFVNDIVGPVIEFIKQGYVTIYVCKLLI